MTAGATMDASPVPTAVYADLRPGDPMPWFYQRTSSNPCYAFHLAAGRYVVLTFYVSSGLDSGRAMLQSVVNHRQVFDDERVSFYGVSLDPRDEANQILRDSVPGIRFFWDTDGTVSRAAGSIAKEAIIGPAPIPVRQFSLVLDPTLRVMARFNIGDEKIFQFLASLPPPELFAGIALQAPVLMLPNVFEPGLCRELVAYYGQQGGERSGFMRDVGGKTVLVHDPAHKRRKDVVIQDAELVRAARIRVLKRIVPEVFKAFMFKVSRMERYIVSCYAEEDLGHFNAHRDNTTKGTAHRRFAVSINLNDDFEGGEIRFPEYGARGYKMQPGTALVFSCSLLHAVSPVTRGNRFVFLPFLYDEEASAIREKNLRFLHLNGNEEKPF